MEMVAVRGVVVGPQDAAEEAARAVAHVGEERRLARVRPLPVPQQRDGRAVAQGEAADRSEEHTFELQPLMRISYAVFCLIKKNHTTHYTSCQLYTLSQSDYLI